MNARQLLAKFPHVKKTPNGWDVRCPAHDDNKPSLSIAEGDKGILLHCHVGCRTEDIVATLGLQMTDLLYESQKAVNAPKPVPKASAPPATKPKGYPVHKGQQDYGIVASYDYRDIEGNLLYQVVRKEPKSFLQRRPDGEGGWIWKVAKQVKRVPYRLPEIAAEPVVFVVEGEKDVNRLMDLGVPATCNAGGAGKWGASESKALAAACVQRVVIIPDNDDAGQKHAQDVAAKCKKVGLAVSVVQLPNLPNHGDVSDWLDSGGTIEGLKALAAVPYVLPTPAKTTIPAGYSGPVTGCAGPAGSSVPDGAGMVGLGVVDSVTDDVSGLTVNYIGFPPLTDPTKYGSPHGDGAPLDVGAAEAFRDRFGDRVRYDHHRACWYLWTGQYWKPDATAEVYQLAIQHARLWRDEASKVIAYSKRAELMKFLAKLDRRQAIENMLTCATWLNPIATEGKGWDRNPMLFGVRNGVIDLATGQLKPGEKAQLITQIADFEYSDTAPCDRWLQFMDEVFDGDQELITYVHRAIGYSMTADMREQAFFLCVGHGANGKSIFLDTLEYVFGSYAQRASMKVFTGEGEKFHLAELEAKRLIVASETKPNTRINEHVLKNFTGGETQSAERKGVQPFTFTPIGKIWMGVNHEPKVADDSYGFWRRVRLIPFLRTFSGSTEDRNLRDKLRTEAAGIVRWCVAGCLDWQAHGLPTPAAVMSATEKYQAQENPLSEFFAEKCQIGPEATTTTSALIAAYTTWCDDQGIRSYDRLPRRSILAQLEKQFVIVNIAGINRVRGIEVLQAGQQRMEY